MDDQTFIELYRAVGPVKLAGKLGMSERRVHERRAKLEAKHGVKITPDNRTDPPIKLEAPHVQVPITDGVVLVGGDAHYWPGVASTAHRAFVSFCKEMKPKAVLFNGDVMDCATVSRHPPIGWEHSPTLEDELLECQERLSEIADAARKAHKVWCLGNHDARFNTRLATVTPEFKGVQGTRLVHHFPAWEPCWSAEVGGSGGAIVKHRFKGGMHATHNNALWAGRSMITGHLHSQKVTPLTDYNGTRWGVDCGCLAPIWGPQFNYQEHNPRNHRSGFCVLTFRKGTMLWPELVTVHDEAKGVVNFRGELLDV